MCRFSGRFLLGVATLFLAGLSPAWGQSLRDSSVLQYVPADVDLLLSFAHNREQVEKVAGSRAVAKIVELFLQAQSIDREPPMPDEVRQLRPAPAGPNVLVGLVAEDAPAEASDPAEPSELPADEEPPIEIKPANPLDEIQDGIEKARDLLENADTREIAEVVMDMLGDEVFFYTQGYDELLAMQQEVYGKIGKEMMRYAKEHPDEDLDAEAWMKQLDFDRILSPERVAATQTPTMVLGFKLRHPEQMQPQLDRLEPMIKSLLEEKPELLEGYTRQQVAGQDFLTLTLRGEMLVKLVKENENLDPDALKRLEPYLPQIQEKQVVIALGVLGDYFLVTAGKDLSHLENWGKGDLLLDRAELAELRKVQEKTVVSISYSSSDLGNAGTGKFTMFDYYRGLATYGLRSKEFNLGASVQQRLGVEVDEFFRDMQNLFPAGGAALRFVVWDEDGYQGYLQNWAENLMLDGSQPLSIVNHLGGDPLAAFASRSQYHPEYYDILAKWSARAVMYWEELGVPQLPEDGQQGYTAGMAFLRPFILKFHEITHDKLIPSQRDSQVALVIDDHLKLEKIASSAPALDKPLAVSSPAIVMGVSDAELFQEAINDYRELINMGAFAAQLAMGDKGPKWGIPKPENETTPHGELYFYQFPIMAEAGMDDRLMIVMGINADTTVLTIHKELAARILQSTPPSGAQLKASVTENTAGVAWFEFPRLVNIWQGWAEYGVNHDLEKAIEAIAESAEGAAAGEVPEQPEAAPVDPSEARKREKILALMTDGFNVLRCFEGYQSRTVVAKDRSVVTRFTYRIHDLPQAP
ncbi:hypothetical protein [Lignipirellula cremea]|uniref:Uncharacterized protein n=1 Tax=Lignipirellula cremea TaxID=2528010 RepID=A0A518DS38_9BACT|nr:hypothetical protein [Lignipirellula cremea]QDU94644.1 hypothetical protein Pla8534_24370 [Lignipirellula cremea]